MEKLPEQQEIKPNLFHHFIAISINAAIIYSLFYGFAQIDIFLFRYLNITDVHHMLYIGFVTMFFILKIYTIIIEMITNFMLRIGIYLANSKDDSGRI